MLQLERDRAGYVATRRFGFMTAFKKATIPQNEVDLVVNSLLEKPPDFFEQFLGPNPTATQITEYMQSAIADALEGQTYLNDLYQVNVREAAQSGEWPAMVHLSIKRLDRQPIHDWRELQTIKDELVGPENEGVELYPARSRIVDTANQYHVFVLKDPESRFPFGFQGRVVTNESIGKSVNRQIEALKKTPPPEN